MQPMIRVMVFDRLDSYLCDIDPSHVVDVQYTEEINGEHSITITTTQELEKTNRLLIRDGMGVWHEYVVLGIVATHESVGQVINEYYCVWSLQYDLAGTFINGPYDCGVVPGHASIPQLPHRAMEVALGSTTRWEIGTITVTTMAAASFYRRSGWEGLQTVIERWGGEIQASISVGADGVVSRAVDLLAHVGQQVATRRFDYGHDLTSIKRTVSDDIWPCRIVPLGKSQETDNGGYTRRPSIESVNDGVMWIQDDEVAPYVRVLNPDGEWEYPTVIVENDTYEQPADLLAWALANVSDYTRPRVTYEADVAQFVRAGLNPHGVSLGDKVVAVDRTFCSDGLRISARIVKIEGSLLDPTDTTLTIGNATDTLAGQLTGLSRQVSQIAGDLDRVAQYQATADYLSGLLDRLNQEVNATGGYVYITDGEGLNTYDVAVSDPSVGSEASSVVQIRGGNIRIANSRTPSGGWDFKTLLQSGHILAELVTAANIVAGHIGSADSGNYWNLDTGDFRMAASATLGGKTVQEIINGVDSTITGVDVEFAESQSDSVAPTTGWGTTAPAWRSGYYIWQRTATTTASGTDYSTPVMVSGRNGADGSDGDDGVGITDTVIRYGASASDTTEPTSWQASVPTLTKGQWLWVRTVYAYTDNTTKTTYAKSYVGTDGADGTSVYVQSTSKVAGVTTVVLSDGTTLTISDGEDGDNGTAGANGYVHTAWANSADGSTDFSTSVSAGKAYLGVYTDNTYADSQTYSDYSWSLIKGADGQDGKGATSIVEQYYLSTSNTTQTGGSWSTTQPTWESGKYIWTRTETTWDTTPPTTTTSAPVLAGALNKANETASDASNAVTNLSSQQAIFNLLTDNGNLQGLYMSGGQLYINASYLIAGHIGNASNSSYWDLDTGLLHLGMSYNVTYGSSSKSYLLIAENGYIGTPSNTKHSAMFGVTFSGSKELYGFKCETGAKDSTTSSWVALVPCNYNGQMTNYDSCLVAKSNLRLFSNLEDTDIGGFLELTDGKAALRYAASDLSTSAANVYVEPGQIEIVPSLYRNTTGFKTTSTADSSGYYNRIGGSTYVSSLSAYSLTVTGSKSRAADTDSYGTRLLYSVESPTPMFSDIGSGVIGEDGTCYVAIDDVFTETVRTDLAYQVFLQKCGDGDLWVAEKHATHFVVQGTPGIAFDWELKARQAGFETMRLDSLEVRTAMDVEVSEMAKVPYEVEEAYDEMGAAETLEAIWMQELADLREVNA